MTKVVLVLLLIGWAFLATWLARRWGAHAGVGAAGKRRRQVMATLLPLPVLVIVLLLKWHKEVLGI